MQNIGLTEKSRTCIKMGKEILTFSDIETEKNNFYRHKNPVPLRDVDTEKVLVSNKVSSIEKTINTLLVTCIMMIELNHNTS